jgi:pumilio RNA-binding family
LLEAVQGRVQVLAFDASGCRLVQDALESSPEEVGVSLAEELRGHVRRAIDSPHANFVLQKMVDVLPVTRISFVIDEIAGAGVETARHRNGCRVLSRVFEHWGDEDHGDEAINEGNADAAAGTIKSSSIVSIVMDEVLQEATALSRHPLGHFVIEAILQHGTMAQRAKVAGSLRGRLTKNAKNRSASYIVERALQLCGPTDRDAMVAELLSNESDLLLLAQCRFGRYVVKTVASLDNEDGLKVRSVLQASSKELRANKYGLRLFDEMEQSSTIRD